MFFFQVLGISKAHFHWKKRWYKPIPGTTKPMACDLLEPLKKEQERLQKQKNDSTFCFIVIYNV